LTNDWEPATNITADVLLDKFWNHIQLSENDVKTLHKPVLAGSEFLSKYHLVEMPVFFFSDHVALFREMPARLSNDSYRTLILQTSNRI
jgi:hypothetical protein